MGSEYGSDAGLPPVYVVGFARVPRRLHLDPCTDIDLFAVKEGLLLPRSPVPFRRDVGNRVVDLLHTTMAVLEIVSPRVLRVLEEIHATGWHAVPVTVVDYRDAPVEGHAILAVTGRSGPLDWSRARRAVRPPPVPTGEATPIRVGPGLDPARWDGSDVFMPEGTLLVCVTQRVRDALESAGVTGFEFRPLSEEECAEYEL